MSDLPEYLPDPNAVEETESEPVQGFSEPQAKRRCKEIAKQYDGRNARVEHRARAWWDCLFEVWRVDDD
ncbi:hypothetical protein D0962_17820 [Leptolyngbyaceae cyanobacterium CCMR0082]|uniref:Uncharacterized protein n=1 Tax=Adonisia turfae CCMR0082 TaxID=2304604 RepID=A0A6M0S970_9CYAN|nr:hypothetical protein [Adonisia turfae]NEZ64623.1 hypothetical protein [Adonisia turfae CCMR0082]